ncbi:hypothetical protein ATANTOWER_020888 [Ataeniobius toweri]|uniref:Uncharacterized protein n=1 Tax=Ataeniobius toweri TaxID=208326 RepID=A0ABU7AQR8_9TELE|nr:hypothetical protein [Ataeniobius toweri]
MSSPLPTFIQYVTCCTRDNKIQDLLCANSKEANSKEAYSSSPLQPLGAHIITWFILSGGHQLQAPEVLHRSSVWHHVTHVQYKPEAGVCTIPLEDLLCGTGAEDHTSEGPQQLQAGSADLASDESLKRLVLNHLHLLVRSSLDLL